MAITKLKLFIIILVIISLAGAGFIVSRKLKPAQKIQPAPVSTNEPAKSISATDKPQIIATRPDPLEENIVGATDTIEITFNRPLENAGEFKSRLEPETEYKAELTGDRKTAKIKAVKGFQLGTTYTLFIGTETKFDGVGRWGEEKIYHFKTIKYTGV